MNKQSFCFELGLVTLNNVKFQTGIAYRIVLGVTGLPSVFEQMTEYKSKPLRQYSVANVPLICISTFKQTHVGYIIPGELGEEKLEKFIETWKNPFSIEIDLRITPFQWVGDLIAHPLWKVLKKYSRHYEPKS